MRQLFKKCSAAFLCAVIALMAGCGETARASGEGLPASPRHRRVVSAAQISDEPYRLQVGDQIQILFLGRPEESSLKLAVGQDGTIPFPPTEPTQAAGRSLQELEQEIQNRLSLETNPAELESTPEASGIPTQAISAAEALNQVYQLQAGDQLDITVWGQADLTQKVQIREDGAFSFPLIGSVRAAGRSIADLQKEITERLNRDYIVNPQVTVGLLGAQFSVLGQKGDSGSFPINGTVDLLTAISKAGDIATLRSSQVEVIRRQGDKQVVIHANVDRILSGKDPNIPVLPRDTLYVKNPLSLGRPVTIHLVGAKFTALGEVQQPGSQPIDGPMDVLTAISLVGGITKFGSNKIEIFRSSAKDTLVIRVNLDRILQGKDPNIPIFPRDTLYVRRRLF